MMKKLPMHGNEDHPQKPYFKLVTRERFKELKLRQRYHVRRNFVPLWECNICGRFVWSM